MRIGVYVDTENITRNGGRSLRYDVLREFACRDGADALRLNSYTSFDDDRAATDDTYQRNVESFHEALRDFGYKVIVKPVKWYVNEDGKRFGKANSDLDMAVDVLLEARNIDRVLLATGDGDFAKVARALQNMGCRVEVVAFDNVSGDLRREADLFVSGYLIPRLLPGESKGPDWGTEGSRVRGLCHWYDGVKGFGFIRYLKSFDGPLWVTDTTREDSPYASTFVHSSELQKAGINAAHLPSRRLILEFALRPSPTK
ncbi:MAG: NYN domain-containing protein, partial [Acidobacteriota bacterium]|nr:NYN domain-containing protein [Acidobacteriota bacterium]